MKTETGNKKIANYMIDFCEPFKNDGGAGYHIKVGGVPKCYGRSIGQYGSKEKVLDCLLSWEYKYDTSWDWLMPVLIKLGVENVPTDISKAWEIAVSKISGNE